MAKLKLQPEPTFKAKVEIPVPGGIADPVMFTFKHRTRDEVTAWLALSEDDPTAVMNCVLGWDLEDEFNRDNVVRLLQNYSGAGHAVITTYCNELRGARTKN